ncbi:LysR family transcriptional regulator [Propionicicella superfundia]|uniref:LysR family transcriptional regulator n=1 Tax=Propionicicella superfundia TaxID=348582 RepID=UPI0004029267|nr:LysR substrate-binding domain-containing protein [Propionicicella superfundia]
MDMRQIEFFVAVAEQQNFTRAAELSHVSQPGLSASIRSLERELHAQLFHRTPRGVTLTPAGLVFLPHARRMLEDVAAVRREVQETVGNPGGRLRIGAERCLGDLVDLADLLATFHDLLPTVTLETLQAGAEVLAGALSRGDLDVVVLGETPRVSLTGLERIPLSVDGFEAVMAPDHPLAASDTVTLRQVAAYPLANLGPGWSARQIVDQAFADALLTPRTALSLNDLPTLFDVIRKGLAVAVVPVAVGGKLQATDLAHRPLDDVDLAWNVDVLLSLESPATARTFAGMFVPGMTLNDMRSDLAAP